MVTNFGLVSSVYYEEPQRVDLLESPEGVLWEDWGRDTE